MIYCSRVVRVKSISQNDIGEFCPKIICCRMCDEYRDKNGELCRFACVVPLPCHYSLTEDEAFIWLITT